MGASYIVPKRKIVWVNILFFAVTTLCSIIGIPLYIKYFGVSLFELFFCFFMIVATVLSITVGYHRLFAHATFKAKPIVRFLLLFFGAASFEQSALKWASQHRDHHLYVDTERDPYNIKKGFWYAHIGWLMFWEHHFHYDNVNDLKQDRMVMAQHQHYHLWAIGAGILMPLLVGAMTGHLLGTFLFSVCARITIVYHATFCINSFCHMIGKSTYDIHSTAKDHWALALITGGEGYHNFHHRFPSDFRNGVRWFDWDPSKWMISALSWIGLTYNLKRVSKFSILHAKLAAEHQRIHEHLSAMDKSKVVTQVQNLFTKRYQQLRLNLSRWEQITKERKRLLQEGLQSQSKQVQEIMLERVEASKEQFLIARQRWNRICDYEVTHLLRLFRIANAV